MRELARDIWRGLNAGLEVLAATPFWLLLLVFTWGFVVGRYA